MIANAMGNRTNRVRARAGVLVLATCVSRWGRIPVRAARAMPRAIWSCAMAASISASIGSADVEPSKDEHFQLIKDEQVGRRRGEEPRNQRRAQRRHQDAIRRHCGDDDDVGERAPHQPAARP
jgi:hypothetical protein